ncbi:MAG: NADH:ubiquinone oxidoreductase subunit J [Methyloligella sp.]|jgi:NADH-quinone oxidoreductase subunit J|nr:MAG: NADH:ubiquinone oxidoreductase subunit J [Methyloligella sp.]
MLTALFFYLFSGLSILSGLMVIAARNPVHAVLFLILAFFNVAGLFLLLGAEFLAVILLIVYVGAVAVLFLFVVMMLDVDFAELKSGFLSYLPVGLMIGGVLLLEIIMATSAWVLNPAISKLEKNTPIDQSITNTEAFGRVLYTDHLYYFEAAGILLLVAMVGAIVLTLRTREGVKRQDIRAQVARNPKDAIEIKQVETGKGI